MDSKPQNPSNPRENRSYAVMRHSKHTGKRKVKSDWIPFVYLLPDTIEAIEVGREVQRRLFSRISELEEMRKRIRSKD
jgi:hypothetical protein